MPTKRVSPLTLLAAGATLGVVPMAVAFAMPLRNGHHRDPFDLGWAYGFWMLGYFLLGAAASRRDPDASAGALGAGLPVSMLLFSALTTGIPGLWPLALIVCTLVALPAAAAGASLGRRLGR